jgi:hypothetical protein
LASNIVPSKTLPSGQNIQALATTSMALNSPRGGIQREPVRQPEASVGNATTLASIGSQGGWYQRKRSEVVAQNHSDGRVATAVEAIVPPSVRDSGRYRTAQPQGEQQISRGGNPVEHVLNGGGVIRRFR